MSRIHYLREQIGRVRLKVDPPRGPTREELDRRFLEAFGPFEDEAAAIAFWWRSLGFPAFGRKPLTREETEAGLMQFRPTPTGEPRA